MKVKLCSLISPLLIIVIIIFLSSKPPIKFQFTNLLNAYEPNSAEIVSVPIEVIEARFLAKKENLSEFKLIGKLKDDPQLYQRIIEFLYPIRYNESSNFVIVMINSEVDQPLLAKFRELAQYGHIKILKRQDI